MPKRAPRPSQRKQTLAKSSKLGLFVIPGLPEIRKGHDLARLIADATRQAGASFESGDVVVIAQKIVSKAEGRFARLSKTRPSTQALELAAKLANDPRFIEVVLRESRRILRSERVLIAETHHVPPTGSPRLFESARANASPLSSATRLAAPGALASQTSPSVPPVFPYFSICAARATAIASLYAQLSSPWPTNSLRPQASLWVKLAARPSSSYAATATSRCWNPPRGSSARPTKTSSADGRGIPGFNLGPTQLFSSCDSKPQPGILVPFQLFRANRGSRPRSKAWGQAFQEEGDSLQ